MASLAREGTNRWRILFLEDGVRNNGFGGDSKAAWEYSPPAPKGGRPTCVFFTP
jgi:hypothetical protein